MRRLGTLTWAILFTLSAAPAYAHIGAGPVSGLSAGVMHPLSGLDHVLAMIAVGILAAKMGGKNLFILPTMFVVTMVLSSFVGFFFGGAPFIEVGIIASVIILGVVIAQGRQLPAPIAAGLVGFLAIFHGYAHGTETPASVGGIEYALGFVLATVLLHVVGIVFGSLKPGREPNIRSLITRASGGVIAVAGVALIAS